MPQPAGPHGRGRRRRLGRRRSGTAGHEDRVERLREAAAEAGLDAFVATADESIAYLTGFRPLQLERFFAVVVRTGGGGGVIVPRLDLGQIGGAPDSLERVSYDASSNGLPELERLLDGARRVGVEEDHLIFARSSALAASGHEPVASGATIMDLRARKDEEEIEAIRRACAPARAFVRVRVGDATRRHLRARAEREGRDVPARQRRVGDASARPVRRERREPARRSRPSASCVRATSSAPTSRPASTATGATSRAARPPGRRRTGHVRSWALVRDAQAAAIAACVPGRPARDVEEAERVILETRPDLGEVLHGAGHAIGLAIHEPPFLVPRTETPLAPGMIFTVEPGLYRAGLGGIRLEDDVVVRDGEPEILSTLPLELVEL